MSLATTSPPNGRYTLCTDEEGVVINDPLVLKLAEVPTPNPKPTLDPDT